ncbi:MAG: hypothetical protein LN545_04280 [Candidatus Megaira endosymbiont of Carteria cerasiformis]|jgi:hypothetical protein|nr:hypothetical protein [Candidatus Megaera polyxenophila]MCC8461189.1 hypothetical protein [Candidatus Megaera polyxenophila]
MIALLGSLAGFLSALIPEVLGFIKDKRDKAHELALVKLQIEAGKNSSSSRIDEVVIKSDLDKERLIYSHAKPIGIPWVDALSALVRPLITYLFLALYIGVKLTIIFSYQIGVCMPVWTNEDEVLLSVIMGFWFGNRMINKYKTTHG